MNPTSQDKRRPLPSILTVYRPIEEYWELFRPAGSLASEPSQAVDAFDAFLVHRVLELAPRPPLLIDTAMARTGGASTLIGLAHPRVREVWAITEPGSPAFERAVSALRGYMRSRGSELAPLELVARSELSAGFAGQPGVVILTDARAGSAKSLAEEIQYWLDRESDALVLVLGLGRVGECPAIASLLSLCAPGSGMRLQLLRELGEVLMASRLGLVARHDHSEVADILLRLRQSYTGNYSYLDLIRQVNHAALRESGIDAGVMSSHPTFKAVWAEIEELKRSTREAQEQAAAASRALQEARELLAVVPPALPWLLVKVRRVLAPTPVGRAFRLAKRMRRKLSPKPGGSAHRWARRVRQTLAPTPVGGAYRQVKRVARACLPRGSGRLR